MAGSRVIAAVLAVTFFVCAAVGGAVAQQLPTSTGAASVEQLEERRQALFEKMLAAPANLDVAFEYAAVSVRLGDYEAAITALERMLLFAPGLARVRLELGVLYYRLESYDVARAYLERAVSGEDVPGEVRERVDAYLSEIEKRQSRHGFSGGLFAGVRYQTNANAAPESRDVTIGGLAFQLREQDTGQADYNGFISASLRYAYDLQRQGDEIVIDVSAYGSRYREQDRVDTEFIQIAAGPKQDFTKYGYKGGSLRPYALANIVRLGGDSYYATIGGGLLAVLPAGESDLVRLRVEYQSRDYTDTADRPAASDRDGGRTALDTGLRHAFTGATSVELKFGGARETARKSFESRWEYGAGLSLTTHLTSFARPWRIKADAAYKRTLHDEPDPAFSTEEQQDDQMLAQLGLTIPVSRSTALLLQGGYRRVLSNYDIADYDNSFGLLGIAWKF
jgi:tetratricopeptide (TPR) repeat protein